MPQPRLEGWAGRDYHGRPSTRSGNVDRRLHRAHAQFIEATAISGAGVICAACGAIRPDGDRFCGACGATMPDIQAGTQATGPIETLTDPGLTPPGATPRLGPALAIMLRGGRTGEFFPLVGPRTTIGRSPECDIFLDDITVSRAHAAVDERPAGFVLVDNGSTNGTYVNRRLIDIEELLADGDEVQVGKFRLVFVA